MAGNTAPPPNQLKSEDSLKILDELRCIEPTGNKKPHPVWVRL